MKSLIILFHIALISVMIGCSGNEDIKFVFGKGTYKFTMTDSIGKKIADGNIIVAEYDNNNIAGTYYFTKVYQEDFKGLSIMNGNFEGNVIPKEKTVFINTNPRIADGNVFWNMKIYKNSVSGEWNHSVFRGSMSKGRVLITQ